MFILIQERDSSITSVDIILLHTSVISDFRTVFVLELKQGIKVGRFSLVFLGKPNLITTQVSKIEQVGIVGGKMSWAPWGLVSGFINS